MIDQETKYRAFAKWQRGFLVNIPAFGNGNTRWQQEAFLAGIDLILPLLEQSLEANRKYANYKWWEYQEEDSETIVFDSGYQEQHRGKTARQAIATIESELKQLEGRGNE
jgi:hypothetical protein